MTDNIELLVTNKSDTEIAADLKARIEQALQPALAIMDEAISKNMIIQWDTIGMAPPMLKYKAHGLRVIKVLVQS
jgi:hypothetical protein